MQRPSVQRSTSSTGERPYGAKRVIQQHQELLSKSKPFSHLNTSANPRQLTHKLFKDETLFASLETTRIRTSRGRCSRLSKPSAAGPPFFVDFCEPCTSELAGSIFSIAYIRRGVINEVVEGLVTSENAWNCSRSAVPVSARRENYPGASNSRRGL